jgi:ATP-dependent DNA ligase
MCGSLSGLLQRSKVRAFSVTAHVGKCGMPPDRKVPIPIGSTRRLVTSLSTIATAPAFVPMLATSGPMPPDDGRWACEVKWDGWRAL